MNYQLFKMFSFNRIFKLLIFLDIFNEILFFFFFYDTNYIIQFKKVELPKKLK